MLPFASIYFFVIIAFLIGIVFLAKSILSKYINYSSILFASSLLYLIFYFPEPWHILIFIVYAYSVHVLYNNILVAKRKFMGIILLLIPLVFVKSSIKVNFYPFNLSEFVSFAGLSYISFRIISVFVDTKPDKKPISPLRYFNYLTFVPTLLIGPIDRFARFDADVNKGFTNINATRFLEGWKLLFLGIAYKFVGAEAINNYWMQLFDPASRDVQDMTATMYGYFFYLFFDFAGYSSMAIGCGKMLGIDVPINFNKPFLATNPQEFWRRFHKSLGDWLRDYFFMPFYQYFSRKKSLKKLPLLRQNVSLFLTFLLMGCWNGFEKHYIISGAIFGFYSVSHNSYIYYSKKKNRDIVFGTMPAKLVKYISIFIMFNLAAFAIYIFSGLFPLIK